LNFRFKIVSRFGPTLFAFNCFFLMFHIKFSFATFNFCLHYEKFLYSDVMACYVSRLSQKFQRTALHDQGDAQRWPSTLLFRRPVCHECKCGSSARWINAVIDGPFDATTRAFQYLRNVHRPRDQRRRSATRTFYADCT
jgi:hypothetical protein